MIVFLMHFYVYSCLWNPNTIIPWRFYLHEKKNNEKFQIITRKSPEYFQTGDFWHCQFCHRVENNHKDMILGWCVRARLYSDRLSGVSFVWSPALSLFIKGFVKKIKNPDVPGWSLGNGHQSLFSQNHIIISFRV